jgi:phosphoribosyl 1,2-cyclic phosphodiesterase
MKLKYYGTRGSLPVPGKDTVKYGGNTACVKITVGSTLIVLDGGSGLRVLGNELLQGDFGNGSGVAHIFFTHAHWDHISGFPFFLPAYIKGNRLILYGNRDSDSSIKQILSQQQNYVNFPIRLEDMSSSLEFVELSEGQEVCCSEAIISCLALSHRHPSGSFSYRINFNSKKIVYISDYEHQDKMDLKLVEFIKNADLIIYDAMFTPDEYKRKKGWGHSTYLEGIKIAKAAHVKQLHLFHFNPEHSDQFIDKTEKKAQKLFPHTYAAKEGWEIEI